MHVVHVDQVPVQVAPVDHLQGEGAVAEDAQVALELRGGGDLVGGRLRVIGHLSRPGSVESGVVAALGGAVADVAAPLQAAVDPLVVLCVRGFAARAWKHQRGRGGCTERGRRAVFSRRRRVFTGAAGGGKLYLL